jgi:hypothetical protein
MPAYIERSVNDAVGYDGFCISGKTALPNNCPVPYILFNQRVCVRYIFRIGTPCPAVIDKYRQLSQFLVIDKPEVLDIFD